MAAAKGLGQIAVSLFKPLLVVDAIDGQWFAVVSDGTMRVEVTDWPLWNHCFNAVDDSAVIRVELFIADNRQQFQRGEGRKFSEVLVPAAQVRESCEGLFRGWLGLQRGRHLDQVNAEQAREHYEESLRLARNLLTPKICCSCSIDGDLRDGIPASGSEAAGFERWEGVLRHSVTRQCDLIARLHQQLSTLWSRGKLVCTEQNGGDATAAQLADREPFLLGSNESQQSNGGDQGFTDAAKLQDEVACLTDGLINCTARLESTQAILERSETQRLAYRERLLQLGQMLEDDDVAAVAEDAMNAQASVDAPPIQALHRYVRQLEEQLQAARAGVDRLASDRGDLLGREFPNEAAGGRRPGHGQLAINGVNGGSTDWALLAELEALRVAEQERHEEVQELQLECDRVMHEMQQRDAEVTVLREELKERTSRLVEAWSTQGRGPGGAQPWQGSDSVRDGRSASSDTELQAARREVEQLRQRLRTCEEQAGNRLVAAPLYAGNAMAATAAAVSGRRLDQNGSTMERARPLQEELRRTPSDDRPSGRELRLYAKVESLARLTDGLQREIQGMNATCEEQSGRLAAAESRAEQLQREADEAASETVLITSTMRDKESQLRQENRWLAARLEEELQQAAVTVAAPPLPAVDADGQVQVAPRQTPNREEAEEEAAASWQAKLREQAAFYQEREGRLRSEIQDLEEANDHLAHHMSTQTQKLSDEMDLFQEVCRREIVNFRQERKEPPPGPQSPARWSKPAPPVAEAAPQQAQASQHGPPQQQQHQQQRKQHAGLLPKSGLPQDMPEVPAPVGNVEDRVVRGRFADTTGLAGWLSAHGVEPRLWATHGGEAVASELGALLAEIERQEAVLEARRKHAKAEQAIAPPTRTSSPWMCVSVRHTLRLQLCPGSREDGVPGGSAPWGRGGSTAAPPEQQHQQPQPWPRRAPPWKDGRSGEPTKPPKRWEQGGGGPRHERAEVLVWRLQLPDVPLGAQPVQLCEKVLATVFQRTEEDASLVDGIGGTSKSSSGATDMSPPVLLESCTLVDERVTMHPSPQRRGLYDEEHWYNVRATCSGLPQRRVAAASERYELMGGGPSRAAGSTATRAAPPRLRLHNTSSWTRAPWADPAVEHWRGAG